ncbi:MAG: hypothetical protein OXC72_10655, partial [Roseovarius sp.]|nr:hypothetical protein [Roseovarius sp.]
KITWLKDGSAFRILLDIMPTGTYLNAASRRLERRDKVNRHIGMGFAFPVSMAGALIAEYLPAAITCHQTAQMPKTLIPISIALTRMLK